MMRKFIGKVLLGLLVVGNILFVGMGDVFALDFESENNLFDGNDFRMSGLIDEDFFYASACEESEFYKSSRAGNYTLRKGIDVSHWQNDAGTIDWNKVKEYGVEFVIVKIGGRYNDGSFYTDSCYEENIEGALDAGLRVGVYFWSEAVTEAEAREEANFVINRLYPYQITLPICMDYEWCPEKYRDSCRLYNSGQSPEQRTAVASAFMDQCAKMGYTGMLYANTWMLEHDFDGDALAANGRVWAANYRKPDQWHDYGDATTSYSKPYDFFQFSSEGSIPGISGNVDLNYWYDDGTIYGQDYSAVFDPTFYAERYPDLKEFYGDSAEGLFAHFLNSGMREAREGSAEFDPKSYRLEYADLRAQYGTNWPLYYSHYMHFGKSEGRNGSGCTVIKNPITEYGGVDYSLVYDYYYYIEHNPDVKQAYQNDEYATLEHFVNYGMKEGRVAKDSFDVNSYRLRYSDLRSAFQKNWIDYYNHYMNFGAKEGRRATGCDKIENPTTVLDGIDYSCVYEYDYYISRYTDIRQAFGDDDSAVLHHFVDFGMSEGRQASQEFDVKSYKMQYADLRAAYGNNNKEYYFHFIDYGNKEGRDGFGCTEMKNAVTVLNGINYEDVYDYNYYISCNQDVKQAFQGDDLATLQHFVNYGMKEGRKAKQYFDVNNYRDRYYDLRMAFGDQLTEYYMHFINYGKNEGRIAM